MSNSINSRPIHTGFLLAIVISPLLAQVQTNPILPGAITGAKSALSSRNAGDYETAERLLRESLAKEPAGSLLRAALQCNLGSLLQEEGHDSEARRLFTEVVRFPNLPWRIRLDALRGLACIDGDLGDRNAEIEEWNAVLDIARSRSDKASESAALRGLGQAWLDAGSSARAEPLLRRSLQIAEDNGEKDPLNLVASLAATADLYGSENKLTLAEEAGSRALRLERTQFGDDHPQVAVLLSMLSGFYSAGGEWDVARDYAWRAEDVIRRRFGETSPADGVALANLALVEQRAKKLGLAATHYESSLRILRESSEQRLKTKIVIEHYERVLRDLHRDKEARALSAEAKSVRAN